MPLPAPERGLVICYSFLWRAEHAEGQEEGVKDRPCVIVAAKKDGDGDLMVTVAPITHQPPKVPNAGVEIPTQVKKHLGLDDQRSWVHTGELNQFIWPGPDLRTISSKERNQFDYGIIPPGFFRKITDAIFANSRERQLMMLNRPEATLS